MKIDLSASNLKKYFLDGISNYLFFVPLLIALNVVPMFFGLPHWELNDVILYMITTIFAALGGGAVYGRFLNWWRKKFGYQ